MKSTLAPHATRRIRLPLLPLITIAGFLALGGSGHRLTAAVIQLGIETQLKAKPGDVAREDGGPVGDAMDAYIDGDYESAVKILQKPAQKGVPKAMFLLGLLYEEGKGLDQSNELAVKWYERAAREGNPSAMLNLGFVLMRQAEKEAKQDQDWKE